MDGSLHKILLPGEGSEGHRQSVRWGASRTGRRSKCKGPEAAENQVPGDVPGASRAGGDSRTVQVWSSAAPSLSKQVVSDGKGQ